MLVIFYETVIVSDGTMLMDAYSFLECTFDYQTYYIVICCIVYPHIYDTSCVATQQHIPDFLLLCRLLILHWWHLIA